MPEPLASLAHTAIQEKVFPGCIIGIVHKNGERSVLPFGHLTYEDGAREVREDTMYDMASVTKSIPTASLALQFIEEGKLNLDDRLITFLPEFRNSDREKVLIKHLLTYTVGGYPLSGIHAKTPLELFQAVMKTDFPVKPGTRFSYANLPALLLGFVLECVGGRTLDILARERFFNPLHMARTTFSPEQFLSEDIAPTEIDSERGLLQGKVHDESAYMFTVKGKRAVGHAGLFSTAPDILNFLEMLLNEGEFHGDRYFSPEIIRTMIANQIPQLQASTGLGWQLNDARFMGKNPGEHTFGKTGFTGTSVVCDIDKGIAFTILSNRTYPKRPPDDGAIYQFRAVVADVVLSM